VGFLQHANLIRNVVDQVVREPEVVQRRNPPKELVREGGDLVV
jgi:hypothetical protein